MMTKGHNKQRHSDACVGNVNQKEHPRMIELPYRDKFDDIPEVDPQELANYFNVELSLRSDAASPELGPEDFSYLGIFMSQGRETMVWAVKGHDICATAQPYEGTYLIAMDSRPDEAVRVDKAKQAGTRQRRLL